MVVIAWGEIEHIWNDPDGAIFAQSAYSAIGNAGFFIAWMFVILEILISGGAIAHVVKSGSG